MGLRPFLYSVSAQERAFIEPAVVKTLPLHYITRVGPTSSEYPFCTIEMFSQYSETVSWFNIGQMFMIIIFAALDFESLSSSLRNSLLGYGIVIPPNALESQKSSGYIASMHENL